MTLHSGVASTATLNGTELPTTRWSLEASAEIVRFRNSKTDKFSQKEATYTDARGTIDADYDFDGSPFGAPVSIVAGMKITNVKLWTQGGGSAGSGPAWTLPSAIVTGVTMNAETEGKITLSIAFENDGTFTGPAV